MWILVLNSGSSSCKFTIYNLQGGILGQPQASIWKNSYEWHDSEATNNHRKQIKEKLESMPISISSIDAIGHRIVHGGTAFQQPTLLTPAVKQKLKELEPLAPLHIPQSLEIIEIIESLIPDVPQIGIFDTGFHATMSDAASTYAGPYSWKDWGIKRFGFHGINYEYCSARCATLMKKDGLKIVCCHLGNGASLAAIDNSLSIDTTMGFTPLEGLMMGSRCGSIDPGILLFLEQHYHQTPEEVFHTLNYESGLKGISGASSDMRDIINLRSKNNPKACLSFDMYIHSIKRNIGAMVGVLDGFDALVFTAGIGENSALVRQQVCQGLHHMGVILDEQKNLSCSGDEIISSKDSAVQVFVIKAQEDWCMAYTIEKMRTNGLF